MSSSQTRDGKNYASCLSRKVYVHANGNRHWRDAIKHPASAEVLFPPWRNPRKSVITSRWIQRLLPEIKASRLAKRVLSFLSHSPLVFGAGFAVTTWGLLEESEGNSGILDAVVQDVTNDMSSVCWLWWQQRGNLPTWKCHLMSAQPLWKCSSCHQQLTAGGQDGTNKVLNEPDTSQHPT